MDEQTRKARAIAGRRFSPERAPLPEHLAWTGEGPPPPNPRLAELITASTR